MITRRGWGRHRIGMRAAARALGIVLLAACSSDSATAVKFPLKGPVLTLTSVNGSPLPFTLQASPKIELVSGQFLVVEAVAFTEVRETYVAMGDSVVRQMSVRGGSYWQEGTTVSFRFLDGTTMTGTMSGTTLTLTESGLSLVYQKQ